VFGHKKGLAKKLQENGGTVAWATVIQGKEKWSSASGSGYYGPSKVTDHMRVKLQVTPEAEPPFEAEFSQAFSGLTPFTGSQCKVVYDPADHSRIAVLEDSIAPPGITHEQAERAAARKTEMMAAVKNGTVAQYIEEQKAKALRGELSGTVIVNGTQISPSPAATPQPNVVDQLTKLAELHDRGALTDAEFQTEKAKLLAEG
jgi:Short C-terminal domain